MKAKQITLRLPAKLYEELKQEAERLGFSLNAMALIWMGQVAEHLHSE